MTLQWSDFKDEYFLPGELSVAERIPFRCPVCFHSVGNEPVSSSCGHTVCCTCLRTAHPNFLSAPKPDKCFVCHGNDPYWAPAYNVKFQVKALKIQCPRAPECKWQGTYGDFLEHCNTKCEQRTYKCQYGCEQTIQHSKKAEHEQWCLIERLVHCPDCDEEMAFGKLGLHCSNECKEHTEQCSGCNGFLKRKDLEEHQEDECPEGTVDCAKCDIPVLRKNLTRHKASCKGENESCICGKSIPRKDMATHMASAEFALQHLAASQATVANLEATAARLLKEKLDLEGLLRWKEVKENKKETKKRHRETKEADSKEEEGSSRDDSNVELLKTADLGWILLLLIICCTICPFVALSLAHRINRWFE